MMKNRNYSKLILLLFSLAVGNSFINLSNCHKVFGQEDKIGRERISVYHQEKKDDLCFDFPDDIIDPGPALPEKLASPKITKILNTNQGIKIQWSKVNDATGYRISRKYGKTKWKDLLITNSNQYVDKTVKNGEIYQYRIYAYATNSIDFIESTGTKSITEKFLYLKAPSINYAKKLKNKKGEIVWKTNEKSNGYIIQISNSSKFKKITNKRKLSSKKISRSIFNIKTNKTYYIRVRSYKVNNSKKLCYSAWSPTRTIK